MEKVFGEPNFLVPNSARWVEVHTRFRRSGRPLVGRNVEDTEGDVAVNLATTARPALVKDAVAIGTSRHREVWSGGAVVRGTSNVV